MTRDIASSTVTKLSADSVQYCELIQLHLLDSSGNDAVTQYTTGHVDLVVSTPTSGTTGYVAQGQFINFGNFKETADFQIQSFDIVFTAVDTTTLAALVNSDNSGKVLNGRRVVVYRAVLNDSDAGFTISSDDVYMIFDGTINGFSVSEDEATASLTLNCSSRFINFEATNGRKTTTGSQQYFFPNDKGMEFASLLKKDVRWGQP